MNSTNDNVKEIAQRLQKIKNTHPNKIPSYITGQVRNYMCELKGRGLGPQQIYDLLGGAWSLPTIRQYTKGVKVAVPRVEFEAQDETIQVAKEIIDLGLSIEEIQKAADLLRIPGLDKEKISELTQFVTDCKSLSMESSSVPKLLADLKKVQVSPDELQGLFEYKSHLDKLGYGINTLQRFHEISSRYNEKDLLMAIERHPTIQDLEAEIGKLSAKKQMLLNEIQSAQVKIDTQNKQLSSIQSGLNLHQYLHSVGITNNMLENVAAAVKRYGTANSLFVALARYETIEQLDSKLSEVERKSQDADSRRLLLEAKYAHLINVVAMCDDLLHKYKFSTTTIEKLYEIAKSYGEPVDVFTALTIYKDLRTLRGTISAKQQDKTKLGIEVAELKRQHVELQGRVDAARISLASMPQDLRTNFKTGCDAIIKELELKCKSVTSRLIQNEEAYYAKYAELEKYEPWFPTLRVIWNLIMSPSPNILEPYRNAWFFLTLAQRICIVSRINPSVTMGQIFANKYGCMPNVPIETVDLITMAMSALGYGPNTGGGITVA